MIPLLKNQAIKATEVMKLLMNDKNDVAHVENNDGIIEIRLLLSRLPVIPTVEVFQEEQHYTVRIPDLTKKELENLFHQLEGLEI